MYIKQVPWCLVNRKKQQQVHNKSTQQKHIQAHILLAGCTVDHSHPSCPLCCDHDHNATTDDPAGSNTSIRHASPALALLALHVMSMSASPARGACRAAASSCCAPFVLAMACRNALWWGRVRGVADHVEDHHANRRARTTPYPARSFGCPTAAPCLGASTSSASRPRP